MYEMNDSGDDIFWHIVAFVFFVIPMVIALAALIESPAHQNAQRANQNARKTNQDCTKELATFEKERHSQDLKIVRMINYEKIENKQYYLNPKNIRPNKVVNANNNIVK